MQTEDAHISVFLQAVVVSLVWLALHRRVVSFLDFSYPPEFKHMFEEFLDSWWTQIIIQGTNPQKTSFWDKLEKTDGSQRPLVLGLDSSSTQPELSEAAASNKATTYTVKNWFFAKVDNTDWSLRPELPKIWGPPPRGCAERYEKGKKNI